VLLAWLLGDVGNMGATLPSVSIARAVVIEAAFTALLGFIIMSVATDKRTSPQVVPFVLGATVFAGALVTGPFTGGSFNPARTLGPAFVSSIWTAHWLYWVAPIGGMMVGMRLYDVLRPATIPSTAPRGVPTGVEGPL
jgi:glycerol uptake facilitator-like aquaporin